MADRNYIYPRCKGRSQPIEDRTMTQVGVDDTKLDVEATFCYLGEMLCSGKGCDSAIDARCCVAWGKFRKLLPVLTSRHICKKVRGKVYTTCVCSICGTNDIVETTSVSFLQKLGIKDIMAALNSRQLRWFGNVQRVKSCIKSVTDILLPGPRGKGKPRKTWSECIKTGISECGLTGIDPQDRDVWRTSVWFSLVLQTPLDGTQTSQ